ncbi:hypothetical protein FHS42_004419 [Streptomyces zagrosensis]|uniref:Uncharacterized protein n=1 Tax=Streptomyces zagrosensis TaxID=1042984 RepID=A0A7W9QBZ5_9ACTN|nr:hypothetical protein [Streptomyces zagrosensis]
MALAGPQLTHALLGPVAPPGALLPRFSGLRHVSAASIAPRQHMLGGLRRSTKAPQRGGRPRTVYPLNWPGV